ncbi:MBL fold metallo-hydrolase [Metabacillus sediminilitoris]|uniref:MBL fold metallo-hydrolase n=1 Tax=Metabacillus sediminilitoris TaxID=2567941 RepID=A0A4S4BW87_9BACI|nr:MBL fold metallo-hydrolase [Metabacillus sediminilitoris]QGQ46358.1 MBL fold metallo-hydrolase [Metabacillus sediminilitoris]THF79407.1 MBL fold metallo-hydrolase [Metabacillus sediminilitoris]
MREFKNSKVEIIPIIVPDHTSLKSINYYLVKYDHELILVDAGLNNNDSLHALEHTLQCNDLSIHDLTAIILTHHHIDHVGLVNHIASLTPIPVYVHSESIPRLKRDDSFLQMRIEFFSTLYEQMGCGHTGRKQVNYLQQAVKKNKELAIHANLQVIDEKNKLFGFEIFEVPGHAPDQIALFDRTSNWLISGDLLINHISSNALVEPDQSGKQMHTLIDHMNSLHNCLSLPIKLVFPGHGVLIEKPMELIQKRLQGIEEKAERILLLIQEGISTGSELAQTYYKNKYDTQFSLVMSEIIGHLDYLEAKGRIHKDMKKGIWHYTA